MAKDRRKIEKKRKKEQAKQRLNQAYREKARLLRAKITKYPEVVFDASEGDPDFVALIKETQAQIDLDDPDVCDDRTRRLYGKIQHQGIGQYRKEAAEVRSMGGEAAAALEIMDYEFMLHYGCLLYDRIPEKTRRRYLPYNDVSIDFIGNKQVFRFSSLLKTTGSGGTIYHSRKQPTVTLEGGTWKVGFSRHAIEQAVQRLNPDYLQYQCSFDVHSFFAKCVYHETAEIDSLSHPNQPALSMYDICYHPTFWSYKVYVDGVFGLKGAAPDLSRGKFYFRLGYFPVEIDNGFAKAVTFIRPGYTGTPELKRLQEAKNLFRQKKAVLLREARENTGREALLDGRIEVIKWFHDNGVPQVVQFQHPVFDHGASTPTKPLKKVSHASKVKAAMESFSRKELKTQTRKPRR